MELQERINSIAKLGESLKLFLSLAEQDKIESYDGMLSTEFKDLNLAINSSFHYNGWFTRENILFSIQSIADCLNENHLNEWINRYDKSAFKNNDHPKKIGIVMAGNIPMVGFHDMLCVLICGHLFYGKLSSQDKLLLPALTNILFGIDKRFRENIEFTISPFKGLEAVIATGSDNSSRYFDYYFGKYPNIIRKNRNSIAIINGNETIQEIEELGKDIFQYFGLGCRNVSKLMVPKGYDFKQFFEGIFKYKEIVVNNKYANNYDYNKTVYLLGKIPLLENGFLIIKEDNGLSSPQACLFYEYYEDESYLTNRLIEDCNKIQCLVSNQKTPEKLMSNNLTYTSFGKAQTPNLWDYADGVDTIKFLMAL